MREVRWSIAWIFLLWVLALPQGGWAASPPSFVPVWGGQADFSRYSNSDNEGLLSRSDFRGLNMLPKELQLTFFSDARANELRQRYADMTRSYDERERFGLLDTNARANYQAMMISFSNDMVNEMRSNQIGEQRNRLMRLVPVKELDRWRKKIPAPVQFVVILAAAMYFGQPMAWDLDPTTRLQGSVDLQNQRSFLALNSAIVDTRVDLRGVQQGNLDPNAPPPTDFPARAFRYQLNVSRAIPVLDVTTGLTYTSLSEALSASVSKTIVPNLTASVNTIQPLNPLNSMQPKEETVQLNYGLRF